MTPGRPWTHRLPFEVDSDVAATVTIDGPGGWTVEGMDVLSDRGWPDALVAAAVNGGPAITDLPAEDRPILPGLAAPQRSRTAR